MSEIETRRVVDQSQSNKDQWKGAITLPLVGLLFFFGGWIIPVLWGIGSVIVCLLIQQNTIDPVQKQAIYHMINFVISYSLYFLISAILCIVLIGFLGIVFFWIAAFIFSIIGLIKHLNSESYRYPMSIDFLK